MRIPFFSRLARRASTPRRHTKRRQIGLGIEQLGDRLLLAAVPVTLGSDAAAVVDDGSITLREAISYINEGFAPPNDLAVIDLTESFGTNDKIVFSTDPADGLNGETIELNGSPLTIKTSVEIDASMLTSGLTIDAKGLSNVFTISNEDPGNLGNSTGAELDVTLKNLTITGGVDEFGAGIFYQAFVTATVDTFVLTIQDCVITGNEGPENQEHEIYGNGAGIYVDAVSVFDSTVPMRLDVAINDSVVSDNFAGESGGGLYVTASFGIFEPPAVHLTIDGSKFENNDSILSGAVDDRIGGGAAWLSGLRSATITNTKFINNVTNGNGGAIHAIIFGEEVYDEVTFELESFITETMHIENSEFIGNRALSEHSATDDEQGGGGLWVFLGQTVAGSALNALLEIENSTFADNHAEGGGDGGGVAIYPYAGGTFNAVNSTFSGNTAEDEGGGLWISRHDANNINVTNLDHVTVTDNESPVGGGLFSGDDNGDPNDPVTTLYNTIVSGNRDDLGNPNNVAGGIESSSSFNLFGAGVLIGGYIFSNSPGLEALAYNGGPTQTHALLVGSPAIETGDPMFIEPPFFDQRGGPDYLRVVDGDNNSVDRIDIGAFEFGNCIRNADFDRDGDVDGDDFLIWQGGFGMSSGAEHGDGDADCDGDVDGDDFLEWQAQFGSGAGAGTLVDENNAVQVVEVIISGSTSTHDPFYFSTVVGSGDQLTTVPVGGADTISIVFSEHANVGASDLHIVGLYTANEPNLVSFEYDIDTMTATWKFDNWALGDQYALTLDSDSIEDAERAALDGEWTNPAHVTTVNAAVSEFPSGDGYAGGDFAFVMTLLAGDANLDNIVDGADYLIWQANYNMNVGAQFGHSDSDGDGDVDGDDFMIYQSMSGTDYAAIWILTDLDGDGDVDTDDAQIIADHMNQTNVGWQYGDVNEDGIVDMNDFWLWYAQNGVNLVIVS